MLRTRIWKLVGASLTRSTRCGPRTEFVTLSRRIFWCLYDLRGHKRCSAVQDGIVTCFVWNRGSRLRPHAGPLHTRCRLTEDQLDGAPDFAEEAELQLIMTVLKCDWTQPPLACQTGELAGACRHSSFDWPLLHGRASYPRYGLLGRGESRGTLESFSNSTFLIYGSFRVLAWYSLSTLFGQIGLAESLRASNYPVKALPTLRSHPTFRQLSDVKQSQTLSCLP